MSDRVDDPAEIRLERMAASPAPDQTLHPEAKASPRLRDEPIAPAPRLLYNQLSLQQLAEERYVSDLLDIWGDAHPNGGGDDRLRDIFVRGVLRVVDPVALTTSVPVEESAAPPAGIPGDAGEVELLVTRRAAALDSPEMAEEFIRTVLAPTLARLEDQHLGTREQRVDIIVRALDRVQGSAGAATLADALARYMEGQGERSTGYFATLGNLGTLAFRPDNPAPSYFLAHHGLRGMLALTPLPADAERLGRRVASTISFNMAARIASARQDQGLPPDEPFRTTVQALLRISTLAANEIELEDGPERADSLASKLGLEPASIATLTVVSSMSGVSAAWGEAGPDLARLEATGAIIIDAAGDGSGAVSRLFNAGVSLNRSTNAAGFAPARLAIYALGLRIALRRAPSLVEALVEFNGLQCAGNLIAAAEGQAGRLEGLKPLLSNIAALASWTDLERIDAKAERNLAVIGLATKRLGIKAGELDTDEMRVAVETALASLLAGGFSADEGPPDDASVVRAVFTSRELAGDGEWGLANVIGELVRQRDETLTDVLARYSTFLDAGPFVPLGLISAEHWEQEEARHLVPLDSIVPALEELSVR